MSRTSFVHESRGRRNIIALWMLCMLLLAVGAFTMPAAGQLVDVQVDQFGAGNKYRPGGPVAMRLQLVSSLSDPVDVWVQWEVPNLDGDVVEYGRRIALSPSIPQRLWLYAPLSPHTEPSDVWAVRVFEYRDGRRARELGGARITSPPESQMIPTRHAMIGIVGSSQRLMGMSEYTLRHDGMPDSITANEVTQLVSGISVDNLPDHWEGLMPFEALVWGDALPRDLTTDQADAIREYVRRGGHLVISLLATQDTWTIGSVGQHELDDLLPTSPPRLIEGLMLSDTLSVMSKSTEAEIDYQMTLRSFDDLTERMQRRPGDRDPIDNFYEPLLALDNGYVVGIRRTLGHGMITILGIDLTSQRLNSVRLSNGSVGLPQADVFWNRILGRRADAPPRADVMAIQSEDRLSRARRPILDLGSGTLFTQQISRSGQAGIGLSLTLLLFMAYWLVAGPGVYYGLKANNLVQHSWVGFAIAAAVFTALAWGANMLKVDPVSIKHVTYLDHIYRPDADRGPGDPQYQRAVSWFSLNLPGYNKVPVTIDPVADVLDPPRDLLYSWTPPGPPVQQFPNTDRYRVDVGRTPAAPHTYRDTDVTEFAMPSRSTATYMYANWLGGVDPDWGGFIRPEFGSPISVVREGQVRDDSRLQGVLTHDLPGTLNNVKIFHVQSARTLRRYRAGGSREPAAPGLLPNRGSMWAKATWQPGEALDLSQLGRGDITARATALLDRGINSTYIENAVRKMHSMGLGGPSTLTREDTRDYMEMLSIFHMLDPPAWLRVGDQSPDTILINRDLGQELDLSRWFTRPCLIITGTLSDVRSPIPLRVDGQMPSTEVGSVVMVRWVYPLPLDEDIAFGFELLRSGERSATDGTEPDHNEDRPQ